MTQDNYRKLEGFVHVATLPEGEVVIKLRGTNNKIFAECESGNKFVVDMNTKEIEPANLRIVK